MTSSRNLLLGGSVGSLLMSSLFGNEVAHPPAAIPASTPVKIEHPTSSDYWMQPSAYEKEIGLYLTTSLLYWKAYVPGLWYATNNSPPPIPQGSGINAVTITGKIPTLKYEPHLGWRAQLGYDPRGHHYGLYLQFTYFHDHGTSHISQEPFQSGNLQPLQESSPFFTPTGIGVGILNATSQVKLRYHLWELLFSYAWMRDQPIQMNLLFGAVGAWISQSWETLMEQINETSSGVQFSPFDTQQLQKNNWGYRGGGIKGGIDLDAYLGYGLGFHAGGALAITAGRLSNHYDLGWLNGVYDFSPEFNMNQFGDSNFTETRFIPAYQILLGLSWKHNWQRLSFGLYADYEVNGWLDIDQEFFPDAVTVQNSNKYIRQITGNLTMQGLTTGIRFEF